MTKKKFYLATLDRFGYDLQVLATSEEEATALIMAEYVKAFENENHTNPKEEEGRFGGTYYEEALEDIEILPLTLGAVSWR